MLISRSNTHEITHGNKSSEVLVIPTGGQIVKIKDRKPEKTMQELVALGVVGKVFLNYPNANINSPEPISVDLSKNSLTMTYVPGVNGEEIISTNFTSTENANKKELLLDFVEYIGKIIKIKEDNNLIHDDFQLRHLLYEESNKNEQNPHLYLIDVENAQITTRTEKSNDQFNYFDKLIRTLSETELQIAKKKNKEPNHEALEHLNDVIAKHPLITEPLMQEHLKFLDQLFLIHPFLFQPGEKISRQGEKTKSCNDNRPLSIYADGAYPKNSNHTFHAQGMPKVSGSKMREAYSFLDRLIRGYDSITEKPVPSNILQAEQDVLQKRYGTEASIIHQ